MRKGEIEIYKTKNGTEIQVTLNGDTIWLDAHLIATLFDVNRPAIVKHIRNIYKTRELEEESTCSILEQVAADGKKRKMNLYNLDVIISVGYRVNSQQATRFRQWATQRLKDFLVRGYAINQKRLTELEQVVNIVELSGKNKELSSSEAKGLLNIITGYTQSFVLLNRFDSNRLVPEYLNENITYEIEYTEAVKAILTLRQKLIDKKEATGNKRIGAFLFIWFLEKNKHRFKQNGELKINDNGLVALALLVAQSNPGDKDLMIQLIINLINNR